MKESDLTVVKDVMNQQSSKKTAGTFRYLEDEERASNPVLLQDASVSMNNVPDSKKLQDSKRFGERLERFLNKVREIFTVKPKRTNDLVTIMTQTSLDPDPPLKASHVEAAISSPKLSPKMAAPAVSNAARVPQGIAIPEVAPAPKVVTPMPQAAVVLKDVVVHKVLQPEIFKQHKADEIKLSVPEEKIVQAPPSIASKSTQAEPIKAQASKFQVKSVSKPMSDPVTKSPPQSKTMSEAVAVSKPQSKAKLQEPKATITAVSTPHPPTLKSDPSKLKSILKKPSSTNGEKKRVSWDKTLVTVIEEIGSAVIEEKQQGVALLKGRFQDLSAATSGHNKIDTKAHLDRLQDRRNAKYSVQGR